MDPWQIVAVLAAALGSTWTALITAFLKGGIVAGPTHQVVVDQLKDARLEIKNLTASLLRMTRRAEQAEKRDAPSD